MFPLLLTALLACSHEEIPVQSVPASQPLPAPVLSRSITETTATIVGYSAQGGIVFRHDLHQTDAEENIWEWHPATNYPTLAELDRTEELVCLVPAQSVSGKTLSVRPDDDEQLMWGKMHVDDQHPDGRFYFNNVRHRLSKLCVEVDRLQSGDALYAYYHPGGTFDCLTGEFTRLDSRTATRIRPEKNGEGLYTITFSIVPQPFEEGDDLLRYRDEMSNGYRNYYYEMPEPTLNLMANHMFHVHTMWDTDWRSGSYVSYTTHVSGVSLQVTETTVEVGNTLQLTATVTPVDADDKSVTWSSSDASVAAVAADGRVTAIKDGTATITVKTNDGGYTASCKITVKTSVTGITLSTDCTNYNESGRYYELYEGDTMKFTATVQPENATDKTFTWSCHDDDDDGTHDATVISVSDGEVKALRAGKGIVIVKTIDGGFEAKATILVKQKGSMGGVTEPGKEGAGGSFGDNFWENGTDNGQ